MYDFIAVPSFIRVDYTRMVFGCKGSSKYHGCFSVPQFRGLWERHQRLPLSSLAITAVAGGAALALTLGGDIEKLLS